MTTLSAGNLTSLRSTKHHTNLYLSILKPVDLLVATVNGAHNRGARSVSFNNGTGSGFSRIAANQPLIVETATGDEIVRVKSASGTQSSGSISLAENGIVWGSGDTFRIKYDHSQIWPIPPAIRSGVFFKDYNIQFQTGYATQPSPVVVMGSHLAGFLSSGSIAFNLNSSSSYAIADGASISSRVWSCVRDDGSTAGISFSSTTAANPTLTITNPGTYWLKCVVTDSNAQTQTSYRVIFVYDPVGTQPYNDFTVDNLSADWESAQWRCSITLHGDLTQADVPDGSLAVIWMQNYFDGSEGYVNMWSPFGNNIVYTGYLWSDNDTDNWGKAEQGGGVSRASFEVISPLQYLDSITDYGTVSLESKTTPSIWSDYASWLTVGRGIHHVLKWDTTILEVCDVRGLTSNTYGVKVLEFTEDTVLQRIQGVANQRGIHAKLACNRIGQLYLTADSQMLNAAGRAALDTIFTLAVGDVSGGPNVVRNHADVRAFADMDGFGYSHPTSTAIISMIPGYIENSVSYNLPEFRGTGIVNNKQQVLNPAGAQTDCNERVGRALAVENVDPKEIRIDLRVNYLGAFDIIPAEGWYSWGIANNALKRELELNVIKTVCRSVSHRFGYEGNKFNGTMQTVGVVLQPEAIGPDGIPGNYPTSYPPGGESNVPPPDTDNEDAGFDANFAIAYTEQGGGDGLIKLGVLGSLHTGPVYTFESGFTVVRAIVKCLEAGKLLVVYDDTSGSRLVAKVLTYANGAITGEGTLKVLSTSETAIAQDVAILSSTGAVVAWTNSAGGGVSDAKAIALTISGTTITSGASPTTIDSGDILFCGICDLDSGRAFYAYVEQSASAVQGVVLSVSGTVITVNTIANASGAAPSNRVQPVKLSSSKVMFAYDHLGVNLRVALLTSVTTTFTFSDDDSVATGIQSTNYDYFNGWMVELSSTAAAIVWDDDNVSMAVIQDSSSNIVVGATQTNLANGPWVLPVVCSPLSGRVVMAYVDSDTPDAKINSVTINSTVVVSDNAEENFETGTGSKVSVCKVL